MADNKCFLTVVFVNACKVTSSTLRGKKKVFLEIRDIRIVSAGDYPLSLTIDVITINALGTFFWNIIKLVLLFYIHTFFKLTVAIFSLSAHLTH